MDGRIEKIHSSRPPRASTWPASRLWVASPFIWEEVEAGTSCRRPAREIGQSRVRYCTDCWDLVGRKVMTGEADRGSASFDEVYHSTEVRGDSDQGSGDGKRREREVDDHSAHGLTSRAATAINELASNPAFWPLMTEEDWMVIREIPAVIRSMIRESGH